MPHLGLHSRNPLIVPAFASHPELIQFALNGDFALACETNPEFPALLKEATLKARERIDPYGQDQLHLIKKKLRLMRTSHQAILELLTVKGRDSPTHHWPSRSADWKTLKEQSGPGIRNQLRFITWHDSIFYAHVPRGSASEQAAIASVEAGGAIIWDYLLSKVRELQAASAASAASAAAAAQSVAGNPLIRKATETMIDPPAKRARYHGPSSMLEMELERLEKLKQKQEALHRQAQKVIESRQDFILNTLLPASRSLEAASNP